MLAANEVLVCLGAQYSTDVTPGRGGQLRGSWEVRSVTTTDKVMRTDDRAEGTMREGGRQINLGECPSHNWGKKKEKTGSVLTWALEETWAWKLSYVSRCSYL